MLGTGRYEPVRWTLAGNDAGAHESRYAPIATAQLVPDIDDVVVLLTDQAREVHWKPFVAELQAATGVAARAVPIVPAATQDEMWEVFRRIDEVVGTDAAVVVDVTHAFRHLSFILFASAVYLAALRDASVVGTYYGAYEPGKSEAPLLDLGVLITLTSWAQAVRNLRETGHAEWLATLVSREVSGLRLGPRTPPGLNRLKRSLKELALTLPAGLPLEAGLAARAGLAAMEGLPEAQGHGPLIPTIMPELRRILEPIACDPAARDKDTIPCDAAELTRQLRLAKQYVDWGRGDRALLLLREWIVTRCLAAPAGAVPWLDYQKAREPMTRAIQAVAERAKIGPASSGGQPLADLWQEVGALRNAVAHAGMRAAGVTDRQNRVRELIELCESHASAGTLWETARPAAAGRLLVTPLGTSPGVLYTLLCDRPAPDRVLIVTSDQGAAAIPEACGQAGWPPPDGPKLDEVLFLHRVRDAYDCFGDAKSLTAWARPHVLAAAEVVVNVTGGTTAMQYLIERIAVQAGRLGVPVKRVALIDRRTPDTQRAHPYVQGEVRQLADDEALADG